MKKTKVALVFATAVLGLAACKSKPEFKNIDGLEYMIVKDAEGTKKPAVGDIVEFHLVMKLDDSLITDTKKDQQGKPVQMPVQQSMFKGDWWTGLQMMTPGDSAVFLVSVDSMLAQMKKQQPGMETPDLLKGKKKIKYEVVLVSVKTKEEMQKEMDAQNSAQAATDDKLLTEYFAKNNLTPTKTASGLYYIITQEGTGENIKAGQEAEMKYIGKNLDGKVFDANMGPEAKHTEAFKVPVGAGQVIRGWDEGLQLLKKGSKATFYIPSTLAYGPQAMGDMLPANSVLIFDVEVVNVK
jgi:FKBP-type peptidyl-prolyl cis-trans isomerase